MLRRLSCILFIIVAMLTTSFDTIQNEVEEYAAKAAFIYNFTKFVEWEDSSLNDAATFNIGILGESPILEPLRELAMNKKINNKKITIIRYNNLSEIKGCHILFIPENTSPEIIKEIVQSSSLSNTLLISEKKGDLENGTAINFIIVNNKIKFEINLNSLNKSNLKASSQLLKLALNIKN